MNEITNRAWDPAYSSLQPWILAVLTLISLGFFAISIWPKWWVLRHAAPENRFNRTRERVAHMVRIALGQAKLFKRRGPGWMHALIFWGFCVLILRAAQFFFIGFFPTVLIESTFLGVIWSGYTFIKDGFVLLVTAAVLFALYRRIVIRPPWLTLSMEGLFILILILIIMMTDMVFEGAFFALYPRMASVFSPIGYGLSQVWLSGWDESILQSFHSAAYWGHILAILIFLDLLPLSKHFHIITSFPNIFFAHLDGGSALQRIDFQDESKEEFGITRIEDFSWKSLLDFYTCTECGRCDIVCPALNTGKPLSPKQFTVDLRNHLNEMSSEILMEDAEDKELQKRPLLVGEVISDETLWSCTTCGACEEECPVEIEYVKKIIDLRRTLVLNEDRYPQEFNRAFKSLETNGNPWGFGRGSRGDWAKNLDIKQWDKNNPTEYLYFVGCNGSFDNRGKEVVKSVVRALKKAGVDFSILGRQETCTGDPARRAGNEYLFEMLASENVETFKSQGITNVITHCPHCFNSLKNEYPALGAKLEVIHHSELLHHLATEGKLGLEKKKDDIVVFHDSCYLGRHNKQYDAPRKVIEEATGSIREVENNRDRGTCCGAGGARFLLEEKIGTRVSHQRVDELMAAQPDIIAVSCPFCVLMLEDALKAKSLAGKVQVKDISELLEQ